MTRPEPTWGEPFDPEFAEYYDTIDILGRGMLDHGESMDRQSVELVLWELSLWMQITRERSAP